MIRVDVKKIKAWMDAQGMTTYQLAVAAGLSGYVLYRILKTGKVSRKHVKQLASAMSVSVKSLEAK